MIILSCMDNHEAAFSNFRMLQGLGAAVAFLLGAFVCVAVKLYIIICLLTVAIFCCAIAEYQIRSNPAQPVDVIDVSTDNNQTNGKFRIPQLMIEGNGERKVLNIDT